MKKNLYQILQIDPSAGENAISAAYQSLAARYTDEAASYPEAARRLTELDAAYQVIRDPDQRKAYDLTYGFILSPTAEAAQQAKAANPPRTSAPPAAPSRAGLERCDSCGTLAQTRWVSFNQNTSAGFMRYTQHVEGNLCRDCIENHFWTMTGKTLLMGWWGIISMVVAPFYLIGNVLTYLGVIRLPRSPYAQKAQANPWKFVVIGVVLLLMLLIGFLMFGQS